jgi:hypothetical protein
VIDIARRDRCVVVGQPRESGWIGSVNSTRTVVIGSTSVWPFRADHGLLGAEASSRPPAARSDPTVVAREGLAPGRPFFAHRGRVFILSRGRELLEVARSRRVGHEEIVVGRSAVER